MTNKSGSIHIKLILLLIAIILLVYGYYGYILVPSKAGSFGGPKCPFGSSALGFQAGPCAYSLYALIIGGVLLIAAIALSFFKK